MARRRNTTHPWTLSPRDPLAVPNARILLALIRAVRRLPGAFPSHNHDDLGEIFAPVLQTCWKDVANALRSTRRGRPLESTIDEVDWDSAALLFDRSARDLVGEALAKGSAPFVPLFDKVERTLETFVAKHRHASDRNVEVLAEIVGIPAPECAYVRLAAAFCYGSVDRSHFGFVDTTFKLLKVMERLCDAKADYAMRMFDSDQALMRSGLFEGLSQDSGADLEDLLLLSRAGQRLLAAPIEQAADMSRAVLTPLPASTEPFPLRWPHLETPQRLLRAALASAIDRQVTGFNVLLHGRPGTGKTEFARQLAAEIGGVAYAVSSKDDRGQEASREQRLASLRLCQNFAGQHGRAVLVLDEAEDIFQDDYQHPLSRLFKHRGESKAWVNELLETNRHPVVWISNAVGHMDPAYLRRFTMCLEFPPTPFSLRRGIAQDKLRPAGCSESLIDAIAVNEHVAPAVLTSAVSFAELAASSGLGADVAVRVAIDQHLVATAKSCPVGAPKRSTRFDLRYLNVQGNIDAQRLLDALAAGEAATLLFSGPPGTGKTQFAVEIAHRLGRHLVVRTASDINTKWYGESERNVARLFRECDPTSEALFLDEADILFGERDAASHRVDRAVTAEFLRWLELFEGVFICATNHPRVLDAALMRRFVFRLEFRPLDAAQRVDLYRELAMGWDPRAGSPPELASALSLRLDRLPFLTAGDFANVARRARALRLEAQAWIDELEAEHAAKHRTASRPIGFMS